MEIATAVPALLDLGDDYLSGVAESLNQFTRLAVPASLVHPLVKEEVEREFTDDFFSTRSIHHVILKIVWFIALLAGWAHHTFMMAGPMHVWGKANLLFVLCTVLYLLQTLDAVFLMIDWAHWLKGPKWIRTTHLILAYIGAIWWVGAAIGEVIYMFVGSEFMSNVGQMVMAYLLMLTVGSLVPNVTIIFKEAFG